MRKKTVSGIMATLILVTSLIALSNKPAVAPAESSWIPAIGPGVEMYIKNKTTLLGDDLSIIMVATHGGSFPDSQVFDVYLYDYTYSLFSYWSQDKYFYQWLTSVPPGYTESLTWNLFHFDGAQYTPPPPGDYYLIGGLAHYGYLTPGISLKIDRGTITPRATHDIAVTNVMNSKTVVGQGYHVDIVAVVENPGDVSESCNVTAYYSSEILTFEQWETFWSLGDVDRDGYIDWTDAALFDEAAGSVCGDPNYNPDCDFDQDCWVGSVDAGRLSTGFGLDIWNFFNIQGGGIGRQVVTDLSAADSTVVVFTWNTTDVPYGNYTIGAKSLRVSGETDITNNIYDDGWVIVTLPGDIDGDYYVGSEDAGILNGAYGTSEGNPNYVPEADIDSDGYIGSADAGILNGNYGKSI